MGRRKQVQFAPETTLRQLDEVFPDDDACVSGPSSLARWSGAEPPLWKRQGAGTERRHNHRMNTDIFRDPAAAC